MSGAGGGGGGRAGGAGPGGLREDEAFAPRETGP